MSEANFGYFNDFSDAEQRIENAHDFYDKGQWQQALHELDAALEINPNHPDWLFNKGLTLDTLEQFQEATEVYNQAHDLKHNDPEILNCLAVDYTRLGRYDLALRTFETLEELDPDFEPGYCNRIITYSELGQHEKAEEMFYLARQLKEHCPLCHYNMGNSLFSRKLYEKAIWCWQQTRDIDPAHPNIDYRIGQAYWALGDTQKAWQFLLAELRRRPGDVEVLLDAGILLLEINNLDNAREKFHRILELQPEHVQARYYLGEIHLQQRNLLRAVDCFQKVMKLNPSQPGAHYRLGECFVQLGQIENARKYLLAELKYTTDQPDILLDLGCLLQQVGQTTEAMGCFEKVIDARSDNVRAYQNLSICYYHSGLIEQGMDLSNKVLELEPNNGIALRNLAYAYCKKGDYPNAKDFALQAQLLAPGDRELKSLLRKIPLYRLSRRLQTLLGKIRHDLSSKKSRP
jgi:tetratricopeptide (TPR) repeat protein